MGDNFHSYTNSNDGFFHLYLQEHATLMNHFQQLHGSAGNNNYYPTHHNSIFTPCISDESSCSSCTSCSSTSSSFSCSCHSSCSSSCNTFSEYETEELRFEDDEQEYNNGPYMGNGDFEIEQEEYEDEKESEYEFELNVDAILAFRAATKELKDAEKAEELELKKSSSSSTDSLVYVDSDKEDFEFVELGSLNTLQSTACRDVGRQRNRNLEAKTQKEIMKHCYGDQSSRISGQETAMAIDFERLCDSYQPSLWPVLPLRL